jgi:23S rRNA (pseudouridine1915-N3)-methyltransferase
VKLKLISVGKERGGLFDAALEEYAARVGRFAGLELRELRAEQGPQAREREADAILAAHGKGKAPGELWALDERGQELTSAGLAERLRGLRDRAQDLTLCIGGDEGLSPRVKEAARFTWSLSRLTLPHRLARVVVLEQLYRAFEILRGSPYHK